LSWENWLFTLTGWPYVARGVTAGFMSAIRPKPITFKVTPKSAAGMPTLPAGLMTPYLAFSIALSGVAVYGELCTQSVGYVLLCIFSSLAYATVSVGVPLLHMREAARNAGERFRNALRVVRLPLILGLLTLPSLGFAIARYVPYVLGVYHR